MPIVNLKTLGELSEEQKAKISEEFTETLQKVANKSPEYVYVVIDEVEEENWAKGGTLFSESKG